MIRIFYREDLARNQLQFIVVDKYSLSVESGWVVAYTKHKRYSFPPGQIVFIEEDL